MFDQFVVSDAKQVVEGGMNPAKGALADAQDEIALGQNAVDALIVESVCAPRAGPPARPGARTGRP